MSTDAGPRNLPDYWEAQRDAPRIAMQIPPLKGIATRRLSPVERATIRVKPLATDAVPPGRSVLLESAYRLALLGLRGNLPYMSGARLADYLEVVHFGSHPSPYASRGLWLLGEVDRHGYGEVWVDAEPSPDAPTRHRRMRLHERLDELERALLTTT